jgi:type I restriction enzyme, R subunit
MTPLGSEMGAVQYPLIKYAVEAGWTYLSPAAALQARGGENGLLLRQTFLDQVQKLNPGVVGPLQAEKLAQELAVLPPRIEGNLAAWEYLRGLKTVFVPAQNRELNARLLAADWPDNTYHVTDELRFHNGTHKIRLDVAFFINGLPVLLVEAKSALKQDGIAEALEQLRRYHDQGPELLALIQVHTLTHLVHYYYGPTWNRSHKSLFNWRDEHPAAGFEDLVKSFVHPQRLTRLLTDFILFTREDDELRKVILRPHQMRAVERLVRRAADPQKQRGLVWHTQGSGKTYTMIAAAKKIIETPLFENPTVLLLVDRNELQSQLFANLASVGLENAPVAQSKRDLRHLLATDRRGLVVSMIHKFDQIPANINIRANIFVLVDEAHRTTGGDLGNYLMAALPNATYLGFTGTPIDRTHYGQGTFVVFGKDDDQGYLDKYSIAQSIEDRTTVPLHYTLAPNELQVDRDTLEREFLSLAEAEGVSDIEELNLILDRAVTLANMLKNPERMARIAAHVADHYRKVVEPMGYKAFLVAVDRQACARYKGLLDQHLPPEYSEVVYSPAHNDPAELARYHLSDDREKAIRKSFRDPAALPKILIVTEKLLTGFDAPVLYCMYLDKPMRDHVLLQAIARVNRPYEDDDGRAKPAGFVLDYVGIFDKLEKALAFDSQDIKDVQQVVTDLEVLKDDFVKQMAKARADYLPVPHGYSGDKATEQVLAHFRDEDVRHAYYRFYRDLSDLYEMLSPDAFLYPYIADYDLLSRIYRILRAAYDSVFVDKELTRKTAQLVQAHTHGGAIQDTLEIYEINEHLLERLARDDTPDTVKIFNLHKSIQELINRQGNQAPYLYAIGERAEAVIRAFQERQKATLEALADLEKMIADIIQAEVERVALNLSPDAFVVYFLLKQEGLPEAPAIARDSEAIFADYPHWRSSDAQERAVRTKLYGILLKKLPVSGGQLQIKDGGELPDLVNRLLAVAGRAGNGSQAFSEASPLAPDF